MDHSMTTLKELLLPQGSSVMENSHTGFYPVVRDLGESVICYNAKDETEFTINKENVTALYKNGDVAFLPNDLTLDDEFDFNNLHGAQRRWLASLADYDKRLLICVVAMYLNECPTITDYINSLKAAEPINLVEIKNKFSFSPCRIRFGQFNSLTISYSFLSKEWIIDFFGKRIVWDFETMLHTFQELFFLTVLRGVEEFSDIELMAYYRIQGYLLRYEPEYDIWKLKKCSSSKTMTFNGETDLKNFEQIKNQYDNYAFKGDSITPSKSPAYQPEELTLKAFKIPKGTIVFNKSFSDSESHYYVHSDSGKTVTLQPIDEKTFSSFEGLEHPENFTFNDSFEVPRKAISYVIPYNNELNITYSARYIPFGVEISSDCSISSLYEQESNFFCKYSNLELIQSACLFLLQPTNQSLRSRFIQTFNELDLSAAKEILSELHKLEYSNRFLKVNEKAISYTPSKNTKIKVTYDNFVNTMFNMLYNVNNLDVSELNIPELQFYYSGKGFELKVFPNNFMVLRSYKDSLHHLAFHSHKQSPYEVDKLTALLNTNK